MTDVQVTILVLLVGYFLGQAAFIYRYGWFSPWRATWQGVILMAQTVTMASLILFYILDTVAIGPWPGRTLFLLVFLVCLTLESWLAFAGLLYVQRSNTPVSTRQGTGLVHPGDIKGEEMSNLDPADYKNGQPINPESSALVVGETVKSSSPQITLGPSKAILAAIGAVVTAVSVWLTTGPLTDGALDLNEGIALAIAILGGLGFGVGTYQMPTKVSGTAPSVRDHHGV